MCECITRSEIITAVNFFINHIKTHGDVRNNLNHFDDCSEVCDNFVSFVIEKNLYILHADNRKVYLSNHIEKITRLLKSDILCLDRAYSQAVSKYKYQNGE
uniref:Late expression factor 11 n=1 Tax=Nesodiprion zhejiangensis nucleopolyhedrovirus TaxID=3135970 RepID=A0AAN0LPT0_9BACU